MTKAAIVTMLVLTAPSLATAHVGVRPSESKAGAEERYTVGVPTEGLVATTYVMLELPAEVTVLEVVSTEGASFDTTKEADRITSITWRISPLAVRQVRHRSS
jgi:uncharacterized protein YcnI